MLQTGIVKAVKGSTAEIETKRSSACGDNCASCGLCQNKTTKVIAENKIGAAEGDTVLINMSDKKVLGAAFLVYIVPLAMLIAGCIAGDAIFKSEAASVIFGLLMMAASFLAIIFADRKLKHRYTPTVVEIIRKKS